MKKKMINILVILIICAITLTSMAAYILGFGVTAKAHKSDCIIVLGCSVYGETPSVFLQRRLGKGIELYNKGYAPYIIVSGGKGSGEDITEAEAMKRFLISKGIPEDKIMLEDKSENTMSNIENSKMVMDKHNFKSAIIVSNYFHLKRASLMAKKVGIKEVGFAGVFVTKYIFLEISGLYREIPGIAKFLITGR
ncbi:MAG: YdcF family protein [Bacillota bacterium]|nr:YdcF family protein [Bacillota bacterium]